LKIQYNRNRYYDTHTSRFTTHDPIRYADSLNLYQYARSNPTSGSDPYGFFSWPKVDFNWDIDWDECWPTGSATASASVKSWGILKPLGKAEGTLTVSGKLHNWSAINTVKKEECVSDLDWTWEKPSVSGNFRPLCQAYASVRVGASAPDGSASADVGAEVYCKKWYDTGLKERGHYKAQITKKIWRNCKCGDLTIKGEITVKSRVNLAPPVAAVAIASIIYAPNVVVNILKHFVRYIPAAIPVGR